MSATILNADIGNDTQLATCRENLSAGKIKEVKYFGVKQRAWSRSQSVGSCHYCLPGSQLLAQPQSITTFSQYQYMYTAC